jgi:hypothetical protein
MGTTGSGTGNSAGNDTGSRSGGSALQRRSFLRAVLESAQTTGDRAAPWRGIGGFTARFDTEEELLVELHGEWVRLLVARLHAGMVVAQRTPGNVRDLYDEIRNAHPTLWEILDTHRANPALWEATAREHAMLARVAGLVPDGTAEELSAAIGRALVSQRIPAQRASA